MFLSHYTNIYFILIFIPKNNLKYVSLNFIECVIFFYFIIKKKT